MLREFPSPRPPSGSSGASFEDVVASALAEIGPEHPYMVPVLPAPALGASSGDTGGCHTEAAVEAFEAAARRERLKLQEWLKQRMERMESKVTGALDQRCQDLFLRIEQLVTRQPTGFQQRAPAAAAKGSDVGPVELKIELKEAAAIASQSVVQNADESVDVPDCEELAEGHRGSVGRAMWYGRNSSQSLDSLFPPVTPDLLPELSTRSLAVKEGAQGFKRPRLCGSFYLKVIVDFYWPAVMPPARSRFQKHQLKYISLRGKLQALSTMIEADQAEVYRMNHRRKGNGNDQDAGLDDNTKERVAEFALTTLDQVYIDLRDHQDLFWYAGVPLDKFVQKKERPKKIIAQYRSTTRKLFELGKLVKEVEELSLYVGAAINRADELALNLATLFGSLIAALSSLWFRMFWPQLN